MRIACSLVFTMSFTAGAILAADPVVVSPLNMHGWTFANDLGPLPPCVAPCEMVNGPLSPPAGSGSAHFVITASNQGNILAAKELRQGTLLSQITDLSYATYQAAAPGPQAIALQFSIDFDLTDSNVGFQGRMVYEPYRNDTVALNSWQTWNAIDSGNARWWFTRSLTPSIPNSNPCPQSTPCTWSAILSLFPNIGIHNTVTPSVVLKAGSGWSGFNGNVDALTIGVLGSPNVVTTYDFELGPTSKEECKNSGWQGIFENQGQCVSYFQSNKP